MKPLTLCLVSVALLGVVDSAAHAQIPADKPLEIRILLDNSGSMYPGYREGGHGIPKSVSGVSYFREYAGFQAWLSDFVAHQAILDGGSVSMAAFTSYVTDGHPEFQRGDVKEVQPRVALRSFDTAQALGRICSPDLLRSCAGDRTYLAESLDLYSRGFQGLLWVITDNIIETGRGEPADEVVQFFRMINNQQRYRSVHVFKYPFEDMQKHQSSNLAVYAILVSEDPVEPESLKIFERKLREDFLLAKGERGRAGTDLFPGHEYLKLKDLSFDPIELQGSGVEVEVQESQHGLFSESQTVRLRLQGTIQSHLTQHAIYGGRYSLRIIEPFKPPEWAETDYGVRPVPADVFAPLFGENSEPIQPGASKTIEREVASSVEIPLETHGFWAWLRSANRGLGIEFEGKARMTFDEFELRLNPGRMKGVFGTERAAEVFGFEKVQKIKSTSSDAPVRFTLRTSPRRQALLALLLLLILLPLGLLAWLLSRSAWYQIEGGGKSETIALRRLGRYQVFRQGHGLGRLSRGLSGQHAFVPQTGNVALVVTPATTRADAYDVRIRNGESFQLLIQPMDKKQGAKAPSRSGGSGRIRKPADAVQKSAPPAGSRPTSPPSQPSLSGNPSSARRPPIRRP